MNELFLLLVIIDGIVLKGGSRGRVQGVRTIPPSDDLRLSNTTGILQKKKEVSYAIPYWCTLS